MYISRRIENNLVDYLNYFPAIALLGPRQVGKTTMVKMLQDRLPKNCIYLDLENPLDVGALQHPIEFFKTSTDRIVIIDEIQRMPELFPVLRSAIDMNRQNGKFILLGSASKKLLHLSNETLAGRIVYIELTPFTLEELGYSSFREHLLKGGFPTPYTIEDNRIRFEWMKSFLLAYIERDLTMLGLSTSTADVQRLLYMLSAIHGGLLNFSSLSKSLGVSSPTVKNIINFFERSFIIRILNPWYPNIGKRIIKTPKLYIRDSGIINHLLSIKTYEDFLKHPLLGNLWEGYAIENIINTLGDTYQYYFYRTADSTECDLLVFEGVKCKAALDMKFAPQVQKTKSMTITIQDIKPEKAFFVIPECPNPYTIGNNIYVVDIKSVLDWLKGKGEIIT